MMEDRVAPDRIEGGIGEGEMFGIGLLEGDGNLVRGCATLGLGDVSRGQIERRYTGSVSRHDDRSHPMSTTVIERITPT